MRRELLRAGASCILGLLLLSLCGCAAINPHQTALDSLLTLIEQLAGCSIAEIHALYGQNDYRRYEQRALEELIQQQPQAVIATPGGIVSEPATFNFLLSHCYTVWLQASPEDHMSRVLAQGDSRPMSGNREAMEDLRRILDSRAPFYSKADCIFDTSRGSQKAMLAELQRQLQQATQIGQRQVA